MKYGTPGLEIWNPAQGIWNSGIQVLLTKNLESNNWNLKSRMQNCFSITLHGAKVSESHKAIISHWKHYGAGKDFFYKLKKKTFHLSSVA